MGMKYSKAFRKGNDMRREETGDAGAVRRQLFIDECPVVAIDEVASDNDMEDELQIQEEDSSLEESADEEEHEKYQGLQYVERDKVTTWDEQCPPRNRNTRMAAKYIVKRA